jgi:glycerol uptake facilitator protein
VIGTFVLVYWVLESSPFSPVLQTLRTVRQPALGYAGVAFTVIAIGASLGGPTGYAVNPARDFGPRLAYSFLPIKGKGSSNWGYAWIPIVGPLIGALLAVGFFELTT